MNCQPTNEKIDQIFKQYITPGSPGCALAVMKDGEIIYRQGYGLADLEHQVPILPHTVFNIGSISKQFTAFAIALLEVEGKLSIDDDIRKFLPEMPDFGETVTIRHLIHHTSGMRDTFPELLALAEWRNGDITLMEDVSWLLRNQRELNFRPGEEFLYSNANYVLLALICERVSGQSLAAFSQQRIFEPLGMTSTLVNDTVDKIIPHRAGRYYQDGQGGWINCILADAVVGPTNVHSTVEDLAKWEENFYGGQVGGPDVLKRVLQPGQLNNGTFTEYAFGLEIGPSQQHRGWQLVQHGGEHGAHSSFLLRIPECHLSVAVMFNLFLWNTRSYAYQVADVILDEMGLSPQAGVEPTQANATEPVKLSETQLAMNTGLYFNPRRVALRKVDLQGGKLRYQGMDLAPLGKNLYYFVEIPGTRIEFFNGQDSRATGLVLTNDMGVYDYERIEAIPVSPDELPQYAGCYYSPELDITWTVVAKADHLVVLCRKYVDSKLTSMTGDIFSADMTPLMSYPSKYLIVFERDTDGTLTGLHVSGNSVRRLRFERR